MNETRRKPAKSVLCKLHSVDIVDQAGIDVSKTRIKEVQHGSQDDQGWLRSIEWPDDPHLAEAVRGLVSQYKDVFSVDHLDYGRTHLAEHRINLIDDSPIKIRHRRIPPSMYDEVRQYLRELEEAGQIDLHKAPLALH